MAATLLLGVRTMNEFLSQFLALLVKMADVKMADEDVAYTRLAYAGVVDAFINQQSPQDQLRILRSTEWRYFFRATPSKPR